MEIVINIIFIVILWISINFLLSMVWDIKQPQGKMVGPHIKALLFFPWFKRLCNQHYYETVDDKVNKTMKRIYGDNWTDYLEDKNWRD